MCSSVLEQKASIIDTYIMDRCIMDMQYLTSSSTSYSQLDHSLSQKPPDKCRSDIGAAGMRSKYAPNILISGILHIITPPGQDGIGVGRHRNNDLPMELFCLQWPQTEK